MSSVMLITVPLVQSESCVGCVLVDVDEIPATLRDRASNPILLAYKFAFVAIVILASQWD